MPGSRRSVATYCLVLCLGLAARAAFAATPADSAAAALERTRYGPALPPDAHGDFYFYRHLDYGSDALVHPLRMILNGGYGIMQVGDRDNHVFKTDYARGAETLWKNLRDPFGSIRHEGWSRFLRQEVLPFSTSTEGARYWPNYTQHLIGGGMSYRITHEWFRVHGFAHPGWWSAGAMTAYHVLNETVESSDYSGWTTDPVADLLIFDPGGILLFSSDRVSRFFGETLHMTDWSYQPCYDPFDRSIENIGQNYVLKYRLPRSRAWHLIYHYGTHGEAGLAHWGEDGNCYSFAGGFVAGKLRNLGDGVRTVDLVPSAGVFWDRHNSLLVSLLYARTQAYRLRLNVYPGVVRLGSWSPGFFTALDRDWRLETGITFSRRFPFGVAAGDH